MASYNAKSMQKRISHDTPAGGILEIGYKEENEFWGMESITLPIDTPTEAIAIWKDEALFRNENYELRIPTEVLVKLVALTKEIVNKNDSWWSDNQDVRDQLKRALK